MSEIKELDRVESLITVPGGPSISTINTGEMGTVIVVGGVTSELLVEFSGQDGVPYAEHWFDSKDLKRVVGQVRGETETARELLPA